MELKNGKLYLPTCYKDFDTLKKKSTKSTTLIKAMVSIIDQNGQTDAKIGSQFDDKKNNYLKSEEEDTSSDEDVVIGNVSENITYSKFQEKFDQFENTTFDSLIVKLEKQKERLKQPPPIRTIQINQLLKTYSIQSIQNIRNIEQQLKAPIGRRNIDRLDHMLSFNKFFVILNRQKRIKIYDQMIFMVVDDGDVIYSEGSVQDYMYVIIKGCVRQFEKKNTSFHQKLTVNFITHYQGSNFGDAQLVGQKNQKAKRHHTAIACEKCFLLKIDNNYYRDLITTSKEDDFQKKISSLLSTSIFSQTSKIFVTPLLSTLQKVILNFGEVLFRQGDSVRKLYFIGDGNLKLVYVDRSKRNMKHLNIEQKPKNMYVRAKSGTKRKEVEEKKKNYSIHSTFYFAKEDFERKKQFNYGKKKMIGDQLEYNDQIVFDQLRTGDFLGGKSFLTPEQREIRSQKSIYFDPNLQSKLTVLGSSTYTTIYCLEQRKFFSLSDSLQKVIIDGIMTSSYFDEKDIQTKIQSHREWKKYSESLVSKVFAEKKSRTNSFRL